MPKIRVAGTLDMRGQYVVELDISEKEFDSLSERKQNELISDKIDWHEWLNMADINDVDMDDLDVLE